MERAAGDVVTLPAEAIFEAEIAGGLALWDVSFLLPTGGRKYPHRDPEGITRIYIHDSGADGQHGFDGARNSARYVVEHRHWPGAAYHFWCPSWPDRDAENRMAIYRMQRDDVLCYHTGGLNKTGIGVCVQGRLGERGGTPEQIDMLEGLLPWLRDRYRLLSDSDWLSMHSEAHRWGGHAKPSCPGPAMAAWVRAYRERAVA